MSSSSYKETLSVLASAAGITAAELEQQMIDLHAHVTPNGRAVAAVIFYRASDYWSDFFDLADQGPLAIWAEMFDLYQPFVTPDIAEQAVDAVHEAGITDPGLGHFVQAAAAILKGQAS